METLLTPRLMLRSFRDQDAQDLFTYAQSPRVGPAAGWPPHQTLEDSRKILRMFQENQDVWGIELMQNHRLIGSVGLHRDVRRPDVPARMLGYVLSDQYWGQGLIPEAARAVIDYAFGKLGIEILSVYHYPFNHASQRVIEKCGFRKEGVLRKACRIYDGRILDEVCYSMTADEFAKVKASWEGQTGQIKEKSSK